MLQRDLTDVQAQFILCDLSHMYVVSHYRAKALKRLNIRAGSTKPSLFAYLPIGFSKRFISLTA